MEIARRPCWIPAVVVDRNSHPIGKQRFAECPTSYITPESVWILEQVDSMALVFRDAGATLFGPDLGKHPAWWVDALATVASAKNDYERAEFEAMKAKK